MIQYKAIRPSAALCALASLLPASAAISSATAQSVEAPADGYKLVWSDEFDGGELDRSKWCTRLTFGGGAPLQRADSECLGPTGNGGTGDFLKDERERYRDTNSRDEALHVVDSGVLSLRATKTGSDDYASYESSLIRSKFEFKPSSSESYYITARLRLPGVRGSFAALWLASGFGKNGKVSWPPEIDTLEAALNEQDDKVNMVRVGAYTKSAQTDSGQEEFTQTGSKFDKRWNNFNADESLRDTWIDVRSEWTTQGTCVYINDELAACENYRWVDDDGNPANPATLIVNLAVGGEWAGRYGIDDSKPMHLDVDYVRIFKK
jgi:beta-glucanase (GH16 family)